MKSYECVEEHFRFLGNDFLGELKEHSFSRDFAAKTELMQESQYVKFIPIVLNGLVKVYSLVDDRELLHYYVRPGQSCIMTFSSMFSDGKSKVYACTEEDSQVLLLPVNDVLRWTIKYPAINQYFFKEYDLRYSEMMESIGKVIFYRLDQRVLDYLENKVKITGKNPVKVSHKEIANNLATAREVVSRILKKFEQEGFIRHNQQGIEVLSMM